MNKTKTKIAGIKGFEAGASLTEAQLAKINGYAIKELKAEEVYVRKYLLAHNAVDRDRERFPDGMLDDFANTLPGKSLLFAHDRRSYLPMGLFFDASTEVMTLEQFKALTGETANLPPDVASVKVLWSWFYMLKAPGNQEVIGNIDAGIFRHASIGFSASDLIAIKGQYQDTLYYEYVQPGEALEGSIVWLGAQPGATLQKGAGDEDDQPEGFSSYKNKKGEEGKRMKTVLKRLGLGEDATEDIALKTVNQKLLRLDAVEGIVAVIGEDATVESVKKLKEDAADGTAYRKDLVDDAVKYGALVGEIKSDADSQKKEAEFIATWPIDRIREMKEKNEAKARLKFPDKFTIGSKDEKDRLKAAEEAERTAALTGGKKDYTDPKHNELLR